MAAALFACTKCNSRHPFDELTKDQQLCKDCNGIFTSVKCTYCRTEFQQEMYGNRKKSSTATICKKCEQNVKLYGKPTACEYCNIIAAFIGSKCQRCTNSEKKYGSPLTCDQCKQRCAFDRKDESRKKVKIFVDGKLLCWLCTLSYKRALAKAKQNEGGRASKSSLHHRSHTHKHSHSNSHKNSDHGSSKKLRMDLSNGTLPNSNDNILVDPNSTDHMVALTQLREQIASLQKQLGQKDQQLLSKDKMIAELKAKIFSSDKEMRTKVQGINKEHTDQVQELQLKLRSMQKQVATLTKQNKKTGTGNNTDSPLST